MESQKIKKRQVLTKSPTPKDIHDELKNMVKKSSSITSQNTLPQIQGSNVNTKTFNKNINVGKITSSSVERRYEKLLSEVTGNKGKVVTTLGEFFYTSNKFSSRLDAMEFAWEFIATEDDEDFLNTITILLKDGWSGTFGELINCARKI